MMRAKRRDPSRCNKRALCERCVLAIGSHLSVCDTIARSCIVLRQYRWCTHACFVFRLLRNGSTSRRSSSLMTVLNGACRGQSQALTAAEGDAVRNDRQKKRPAVDNCTRCSRTTEIRCRVQAHWTACRISGCPSLRKDVHCAVCLARVRDEIG